MNKIILIGNLTSDPKFSKTNDISLCKFNLAVNRGFKDGTDFFNISAFKNIADNCNKFLKKGSKVAIIGTLQNRSYTSDKEVKYITEIIAQEVTFLSYKNSNESSNNSEYPEIQNENLPF